MPNTARPLRAPPQPATESAPATGLRALDRLIAAYGAEALLAKSPTPATADGLDAAVRVLCAEARRAHPGRAERMVIALHAAWPTLPAVQRIPPGECRNALLARVVTLALAEFYRAADGAGELTDEVEVDRRMT